MEGFRRDSHKWCLYYCKLLVNNVSTVVLILSAKTIENCSEQDSCKRDPTGFQVQHLNHLAITAGVCVSI